ncbi:hypothetical protein [Streptomyces aureus]|uniref:hypothetical protein n=1 Tax=Streptomyces aureus TaxID=193461 RepID=UPI0036A9124F
MVEGAGQPESTDAVELEYRPKRGDFTAAVRAQFRAGENGPKVIWGLVALVAFLCMGAWPSWREGHTTALMIRLGGLLFVLVAFWFVPVSLGRGLHRLAESHGTTRMTVTDAGVTTTTDKGTRVRGWGVRNRYRETRTVFVVFGPEAASDALTLLPKRALRAPGDADRLRAILDRNLTRV